MAASESKQRGGTPREPTNQVNTGIVNPMLGFLDRNLSRFSQPVRDKIGIGILLTLVVFVLNGLLGPTYIRGQLWMDGEPAAGIKVLHGDDNTITNENGYWTLPLSGNGIPGRIRIDIEGPDRAPEGKTSQRRTTMGDFYALGPWPVWNILRPMNDYVYDIDPSQPKGKWVKPRFAELPSFFRGVKLSVYAQSKETSQQSPRTQRLPSGTSCALSLNEVKVGELSGWFRSSGRAYFEMYLDDKLVDGSTLLYGPGIGSKAGTFPVRSDKELWLPIRTGSDDHYKARLADLTGVAECSIDQVGKVQIHAKGHVKLKMFTDQGETLNSFDLNTAFDSPNQEIVLTGDPRQRSSITVEAIADETKQRSLTPAPRMPRNHSGRSSAAVSTRNAGLCPSSSTTWARRRLLLLRRLPTTTTQSTSSAASTAASWRSWVARQISLWTSISGKRSARRSMMAWVSHIDRVVWQVTARRVPGANSRASASSIDSISVVLSSATPITPAGSGWPRLPM